MMRFVCIGTCALFFSVFACLGFIHVYVSYALVTYMCVCVCVCVCMYVCAHICVHV